MNCPKCSKEVVADKLFCLWCESFIPNIRSGTKAGLFRRWFACAIDPICALLITLICWAVIGGTIGQISGSAAVSVLVIGFAAYVVMSLWLLGKGMTVGKWLLGLQVVNKFDGGNPGVFKMLLREIVGKFVSGLFFSLGFFWAIWDKDSQAWHDKIAGTVVVKRYSKEMLMASSAATSQPSPVSDSISPISPALEQPNEAGPSATAKAAPDFPSIQGTKISPQRNVLIISMSSIAVVLIVASTLVFMKLHSERTANTNTISVSQPHIRNETFPLQNQGQNNATPRWPFTATRLLVEDDVRMLSKTELSLMRNEIYARHGRMFVRKDLQGYFDRQSWYQRNPGFNDSDLTDLEKQNVLFIKRYE